ncbi:MAG: hypothetical protein HC903_14840 [Methylacidiphilales bacterium]|nr:hypothetical protein [Candidatus Methylacidiphilales bacterium]
MARFFQTDASSQLKREVSQSVGEYYGEKHCRENLGYMEILNGDSKGIKQGFDAVFFDEKRGDVVVTEFKGQNAKESQAQQRIHWTPDVCDKILEGKGIYANASETEWKTAKIVKDAYDKGELRYELVTTKVDKEGNICTEHELKHRPEESVEFRQEGSDGWNNNENNFPERGGEMFDSYFGVDSNEHVETNNSDSNTESFEK